MSEMEFDPPAGNALSKRQKAAIIVRLLSSEGEKLPLNLLSDEQQTELGQEIAQLNMVDRATMNAVVTEFCETLESIGITFAGGLESALKLLQGQITPSAESRLRKLASGSNRSDPWERISALDAEILMPVVEEECIEICAVLLSKLSVSKSADLLSRMPGEKARRVAYAVSLTGNIAPEAVWKIGQAIAQQLDAVPARAFASGPVERVGAILNYAASTTRNTVLDGLEEEDKLFAEQVRKAIFTFVNIPVRVAPKDLPKILRRVEQEKLLQALGGAKGEEKKAAEFILENMSKRMADGLREEIANLGKLRDKDVEAAMTEVINTIRELENEGEIFLVAEDED
ncbi:flagellar motor switch protein FliG [Rhodobacteraceae bacterium]|nr:flagellar motor switch protein FliG [Paracoccaceae bacterium]